MSDLVSTDWLAENLDRVKLVDASWYMPAEKRDARTEFEAAHIPGSVFFDIDAISDPGTDLPHMLPSPEAFARAVGALGVGRDDTVVAYDGSGIFSAPRAWWMFKAMGHADVKVLDGGFPKWRREGRAVESGAAHPAAKAFAAAPVP
ncbi:MAG TPA: rhodanese-like domain-containing protein, partial [Rhizomicrobium sp.]